MQQQKQLSGGKNQAFRCEVQHIVTIILLIASYLLTVTTLCWFLLCGIRRLAARDVKDRQFKKTLIA
jgi:hypothetical protein